MSKIIFLIFILSLMSCAKVDDKGSSSSTTIRTVNNEYVIQWDPPVAFEDSSALDASSDLLEYRLYYSDSWSTIKSNFVRIDPAEVTVSTSVLDENIEGYSEVYFAMSSVSQEGLESILSETLSFIP